MNSKEILEEINEKGIYIFDEPFVPSEQIKEIREIASREFSKNRNGDYEFGEVVRIGRYQDWYGSAIYKLFSNKLIWKIAGEFYDSKPSFNEIFLTHDHINNKGLARNGWLHYDRIPTLKFFMYLTDCSKKDGAFCYVPDSYKLGTELREIAIAEAGGYQDIKNRLEVDFSYLGYTKDSAVPLEGPAGTMFVFHSDLFHCGGIVEDGSQREIIRLHIRK